MITNGIIITDMKVIDTNTGCGGSLEVHLVDDETGELVIWRKDLMEMVSESEDTDLIANLTLYPADPEVAPEAHVGMHIALELMTP